MGLVQKYKQKQQQVRIQTNESNYLKGMYFTDVPLQEGYSRLLMNYTIDSSSGVLTPRKGLQTLGVVKPTDGVQALNGFDVVVKSKVCSATDSTDARKVNKLLQSIIYNTTTQELLALTCAPDISETNTFKVSKFSGTGENYAVIDPFVIENPGIHGQSCSNNTFFKKPVGSFAFGNSYYTFVSDNTISMTEAELPEGITTYAELKESAPTGTPGNFYEFDDPTSVPLAYYDEAGQLKIWTGTKAELEAHKLPNLAKEAVLTYTKLGADIQNDDILLDNTLDRAHLDPNQYYVCKITPQSLNPTEAASWGYNMLASDPYSFECERCSYNAITILGILPYNSIDDTIALTPRRNKEIVLKAYFRAPTNYYSTIYSGQYYATKRCYLTGGVDPASASDIVAADYDYGNWFYVTSNNKYVMIVPDTDLTTKRKLELDSKPGTSIKLAPTGSGTASNVTVRWQMRSATSDWTTIHEQTGTDLFSKNEPLIQPVTLADEEVIIKLTIVDPAATTETGDELILATNTIGIETVSDEQPETLNLEAKKYDLSRCTGMCEWEQRLVLWGVPGALNTIFISDVSNPTFFPYPNNIDIFTDPIVSVHNYGNELIVLTTNALYRLSWDTEGTGWTHTLIQQNLHITLEDAYMSCVVKNMFFFKSGEYYYMMVPKSTTASSVRGETTIAPIYKPIEKLLNNFHEEISKLLNTMVNSQLGNFTEHLVNYFSYVDNLKVVVNYIYDLSSTNTSRYLYVQLIYDTETRAWSMKAFEAPHMLYASHIDAIQQDRFIDLTPIGANKIGLQYYKFQNYSDTAIQYIDSEDEAVYTEPIIKNYQYLDTGNREINTELYKRFREFQFKIKNNGATNLGFYTSFLVDGSLRKDLQHYTPHCILDPETNEMSIIVERTLDESTMTYRTTRIERVLLPAHMLQDSGELSPTILAEENDPDYWILNQSAFPGRTLVKVRMPISGKGLSPRVIIFSTNEKEYELLGNCWVYRTMNSR